MFPLFLNLTNRLCVVIGGGSVGQRKMSALLESGAKVRLVCLENRPVDLASPRLEWLRHSYRAEHFDGATLVFAAATPEVNRQVVQDARDRGIWANAADDPGQGDFFVPAMLRRGNFVVAVGTGGAAPALAQAVRNSLEGQFDDAFGKWVALLSELRPLVLNTVADPEQRRTLLAQCCEWHWLERLRREELDAVHAAMVAEIKAAALAGRSPNQV
jgi:precorrin-2 dehydrogenase/sirohydrochlorin ferrochelatase